MEVKKRIKPVPNYDMGVPLLLSRNVRAPKEKFPQFAKMFARKKKVDGVGPEEGFGNTPGKRNPRLIIFRQDSCRHFRRNFFDGAFDGIFSSIFGETLKRTGPGFTG